MHLTNILEEGTIMDVRTVGVNKRDQVLLSWSLVSEPRGQDRQ